MIRALPGDGAIACTPCGVNWYAATTEVDVNEPTAEKSAFVEVMPARLNPLITISMAPSPMDDRIRKRRRDAADQRLTSQKTDIVRAITARIARTTTSPTVISP